MAQLTKYPKRFSCCNDEIQGCHIFCCKNSKFATPEPMNDAEQKAKDKLIFEKTVDTTVNNINGSFSWASAGLLNTACQATLALDSAQLSDVAQNWVYFIIIYVVGVLAALIEHSLESPERIYRELEVTVPAKKAAMGDKKAIKEEKAKKKKAKEENRNANSSSITRVLKFVKIEGNELLDTMENLFLAIISNVSILALNAAATATFLVIVGDTSGSQLVAAQWMFVLVMLLITMAGALRSGELLDKLDLRIYAYVQQHGLENSKSELLKHSTIKRVFKLLQFTFSNVLAWTLRAALKTTVLSIYSNDDGSSNGESVAAIWTYTLVVTLLIANLNTLTGRHYWLYPKDEFVEFQLHTAKRNFIGDVLYSNLQAVVGIAWYDALLETPESFTGIDLETHRVWILYVEAFVLLLASNIGTGYWTHAKLNFKANTVGAAEALFDAFDNWFDSDGVMQDADDKQDKDDEESGSGGSGDGDDDDDNNGKMKRMRRRESFWLEFLKSLIDLLLFALSFASGWLVAAAVKATVTKSYEKVYTTDTVVDSGSNVVWTLWLAFFIALVVSAVVMAFLTGVVKTAREAKYAALEVLEKTLEEEDNAAGQASLVEQKYTNNSAETEEKNPTDDKEERTENVTEVEMEQHAS